MINVKDKKCVYIEGSFNQSGMASRREEALTNGFEE